MDTRLRRPLPDDNGSKRGSLPIGRSYAPQAMRRRRVSTPMPLFVALAFAWACQADDGLDAYDQAVQEARACSDGDECVITEGPAGCRPCEVAVNADHAPSVTRAAEQAECPTERLACIPLEDPRCEAGLCVATDVLE